MSRGDPIDGIVANSGELPLDRRRSLRVLLEDTVVGNRWTELERRAVDRVMPLWEKAYPSQPLNRADPTDDGSRATLRLFIDNRIAAGDPMRPLYAGLAWLALGRSAPMAPVGSTELDVDCDEWNASFYASLAAAGGATWESDVDSDARRRFWEWYLDEARKLIAG